MQTVFFTPPYFPPPQLYSEPYAVLFPPCISDKHTESISQPYRTNRHIRTKDIRKKEILHHLDTATPCHIYRSADKYCRQLYHRAIQTCESNRDRLFCRCRLALFVYFLYDITKNINKTIRHFNKILKYLFFMFTLCKTQILAC